MGEIYIHVDVTYDLFNKVKVSNQLSLSLITSSTTTPWCTQSQNGDRIVTTDSATSRHPLYIRRIRLLCRWRPWVTLKGILMIVAGTVESSGAVSVVTSVSDRHCSVLSNTFVAWSHSVLPSTCDSRTVSGRSHRKQGHLPLRTNAPPPRTYASL